MLHTKSPSTRAAQAAERELRLQRHQARQQKQQRQQANKPATPPVLRNALADRTCPDRTSPSPAGQYGWLARGKLASRLSFGPLEPQERCPIEGGLPSILLSSPSPPPPDDRRCSRSLALPAPHSLKSVDDRGTNAPESSSCVVSGVNGMDTKTNDDRARGADTEKDLLTTSTASIEHACQLGGASLTLPPQRELFGSDSPDQKQQQQQLDDLAPIPFVRGSSNSKPDAAVFDFDVDEIDGLIGELDGGETSATAVPAAAAATSMGPAQAILADPVIQHAIGNAMAVASKTHFMTQEAYTHAAALAAQSQVEVGLAWQAVVTSMHTVAVSLKKDNEKLVASNADLEAEKLGLTRKINILENNVKMLIVQRDRLTTELREPWEASPAGTSDNDNRNDNHNDNDNARAVYDCMSPVGEIGMPSATAATSTTLCNRAVELAAATSADAAAFATPTAKPAIAGSTCAVIGQPGSTMITAAVPAVMNAVTAKTVTTMAPQQCE
eukprot:jgi/Undpi1/1627/HiC_scaffold_11.g05017.m1